MLGWGILSIVRNNWPVAETLNLLAWPKMRQAAATNNKLLPAPIDYIEY